MVFGANCGGEESPIGGVIACINPVGRARYGFHIDARREPPLRAPLRSAVAGTIAPRIIAYFNIVDDNHGGREQLDTHAMLESDGQSADDHISVGLEIARGASRAASETGGIHAQHNGKVLPADVGDRKSVV